MADPDSQILEPPPASPPTPEPESTSEPTSAAPAVATPVANPSPPSVPQVPPPPPAWATKRIDTLTGRTKDLEREKGEIARERDLYKAHLEALGKPGAVPDVPGVPVLPQPTPTKTEAQIRAETEATLKFEAAANDVMSKGRGEYKDFDETLRNFNNLGPVDPTAVAAAFETGAGHRVLYAMAQDLNEAQRILALPPTKMAIEMERIAQKTAPPPPGQISKAPAPINPLTARAASVTDDPRDDDDIDTWMRKREAQAKKRRA